MTHILFHRPTVWRSDVQCSTKVLACAFARRGFAVTYLQSPLDPVHLLKPRGYLRVWREAPFVDQGVRVVHPATPVPVRDVWPLNTPAAAALRYRLAAPPLASAVGEDPDVVWTTVPGSARPLKALFPRARLVFHVVDYYPAFRGEAVQRLERLDYAAADEIYVIGRRLADYLADDLGVPGERIVALGQGVERARFDPGAPEPADLAGSRRPRAVWAGVLAKADPLLFRETAAVLERLGGTLFLIGPSAPWAEQLARAFPATVRLLGPRPPAALASYLVHADLGLMLYDRRREAVYRGQNPLKLYEYAAAGLPILSTPHDEFASLSPPVQEIRSEAEIAPAIATALSQAARLREEALAFAARHDWEQKVDEIIERTIRPWVGSAPLTKVAATVNAQDFSVMEQPVLPAAHIVHDPRNRAARAL
jgi:hypothetical protein